MYKKKIKEVEIALHKYAKGCCGVRWRRVIDRAICEGKGKADVIRYKYFEGYTVEEICTELHIEKSTYYNLKNEMLNLILLFAVNFGIIKL